ILCIIGHPIEHSMSPTMHNPALQELGLDYVYIAFNVPPDKLEQAVNAIRTLDIKGLNVTIPHKENIIQYLDEIDPIADKMGAINTIKNENGYLKAKNTDAAGAKKSLLDAGCTIKGKNILFLGSGGVTRSIAYILSEDANKIILTDIEENKAVAVANEIKKNMDANIEGKLANEKIIQAEIKQTDILINATPLGMHPKEEATPIDKKLLHDELFVFDVIYNPMETKLMKEAAEIGCKTLGGLNMLVNQGVIAFEWWTGKTPNSVLMKNKIIDFLGIK
ncbi:MAG: shikimate dehydrogenase, partial [Candidatus Hermodarchaeota archaeon]